MLGRSSEFIDVHILRLLLIILFSKSLWVALGVAYGGPFAFALFLKIVQDSLAFLQPQLLRWLLAYISDYQSARFGGSLHETGPSKLEGFSVALLMFISSVAQTIVLHQVRVAYRDLRPVTDGVGPFTVLPALL